MKSSDVITKRQLMTMVFVGLLSPAIRLLPSRPVEIGGMGAWVSAIISIPLAAMYVWLLHSLTKNRAEGQGMSDLIIKSIGNIAGKVVITIIAMWIIFYSGFLLRSASERMLSSIFGGGSIGIFVAITLAASLIAAWGKVKSLARTGQIFSAILSATLIFALAFSAREVNPKYILPITYLDTKNILLGVVPIIDILGVYVYFLFLDNHTAKGAKDKATGIKWICYLGIILFLIVFFTIGNLSANYISISQNPFLVMIRNTVVFGIIERIEAVVVAIWVLADFLFLSFLLIITREMFSRVCEKEGNKLFLVPVALIILAVTFFVPPNAFQLTFISEWVAPAANMAISFIIIPGILIAGRLRKKI